MNQNQFQLNNKDSQNKLESIFEEINDEILREDEDIQNELDSILENLDEDEKLATLIYIKKSFPNHSFWKAEKYQLEKLSEIQDQESQTNYINCYKEIKNDKKDYQTFINFLKNKDFCKQNNIPECLQEQGILEIYKKMKDQLFLLFELKELILSKKQQSQDVIQYLLQFLYNQNDLTDIEQNYLEQTIGNLLSPKIFEFSEFTQSVLKDNVLQISSVIQNIQLQKKNFEVSIKEDVSNQKEKLYIKFVCSQKIIYSKNDLNKDLCDLLQMKIEQFQPKDTVFWKLKNKIDRLAFKDLSLYEVCYFQILFYFWIQYINKLNLKREIEQLQKDLQKVKPDRAQGTIDRFLKKYSIANDELHLFITYQLIYFDPKLCIKQEKYDVFKSNSEENIEIAKQQACQSAKDLLLCNYEDLNGMLLKLQNLSITNLLKFMQTNNESNFYHFLFLLRKFDNQENYTQFTQLFIDQDAIIALEKLENCGSFLKLNEIIFLLKLIGKQYQIDESILQNCKISYYIFNNFRLTEKIEQIDQIQLQKEKDQTQTLEILENINQSELRAIQFFKGKEKLTLICSHLLELYFEQQNKNKILFRLLSKMIPLVNPQKSSNLRIFQIMLNILRPKYPRTKKKIPSKELQSLNYKLLESLMESNKSQNIFPTLKTFIDTLFILFQLLEKCNNQQQEYLLTNLHQIISNKFYNFDLISKEISYNTPFKEIQKMLLIQFLYYQKNGVTYEEQNIYNQSFSQAKLCQNLYELNSQLYQRWLGPKNYYDEFQLSPCYYSKYKLYQLLPKNANINLQDFNISLSEMKEDEQKNLIQSWVTKMNDQQKFKQLIPFFFNIIKRGEDYKKFLSQINQDLQQSLEFKSGLNMKALFQIVYNNSDYELQVMLLKFQCKFYPVPLIYLNQDLSQIKHQDQIYLLNEKLYYIFPECLPIINMSLSEKQTTIGKTHLINTVFYQMNKFETKDNCELNRNTIDIMFDFNFSGSRKLCIADAHGFIPISILIKLVPLFKIWIIQLDSEDEILDTLNKIQQLIKPFQRVEIPEICLVIRNTTKNVEDILKKLQLDGQQEILKIIKNFHCVIDLSQKNIAKASEDVAIKNFEDFIFRVILKVEQQYQDIIQNINQNEYLKIIKSFNTSNKQLSQEIEADGDIIKKLQDELEIQLKNNDGFYSITSFPLRSINWQIGKLKDELDQIEQKDEKNKQTIDQIKDKITQLENQIKLQEPTTLLKLFCKLFEKENNYILYLSFIDKIRKFNEQNTYKTQDKIQILNEQIQQLKKQRNSIKQQNKTQQNDQILKLNEIKEQMKKINEDLKQHQQDIQLKNIGIELFWRELISMKQGCITKELRINPVDIVFEMIKKGEPFEFLDGDQLKIDEMFLKELTGKFSKSGDEKVLVLSVLGPQSSGKSTILNKIFGCHFWTSVGRCTKGIYLQLLRISQKKYFGNMFDYILILDSEGLQNPNQIDPEFDKKIALFILSISDIILINVKGDIHAQFKNLVEMCIFTLGQMNNTLATIKSLSWCFNQNNDVNNFQPFLNQIQDIASNLNQELNKIDNENENQTIDYNEVLDIQKKNIQILGFASTEKSWKNQAYGFKDTWRQLIINETFSEEAYQYGVNIIKNFVEKKKSQKADLPCLHSFIQNIDQNWQTICRLPDLLEFTELIQYQQDLFMQKEYERIYKQQDFNFKNNIQRDIKNYFCQQKTNIQIIKDHQNGKEKEIVELFGQIEIKFKEELLKLKQNNKISKKILIKYENRLNQKIQAEIEECKLLIFEEIKDHETIFQLNNGFKQIDTSISQISENPQELKKLQNNEELIKQKFKAIWKGIISSQENQMNEIFKEYSLKQYQSISESFLGCKLKSNKEKDHQRFFIENINKNSPFSNKEKEKEQIMNQFKQELQVQQFEILIGTNNVNIYGVIFSQPIIYKLQNRALDSDLKNNKASNSEIQKNIASDILNIKNYYKIQLSYKYITTKTLQQYLTSSVIQGKSFGFLDDFMYQFNQFKQAKQQHNPNHYSVLSQFFNIFQHFNISYGQDEFQRLLKSIQDIPNFFSNFIYSHEERVVEALRKLIKTLQVNDNKIAYKDQSFLSNFYNYYQYLNQMVMDKNQYFNNYQDCQNYLNSNKDDRIISYKESAIPIEQQNYCLQYIADQNDQNNKQYFQKNFLQYFMEEMSKKNGWNKLYFELYDIILSKMKSNQNKSQVNNKGNLQQDSDEEINSSNIGLIQIIMAEIKLKVNIYNEQFAKFGVILNPIGERCIYYYSMFLIWRFSCYNKWKILSKNYKKLQLEEDDQYKKYKAAIKQNKVEQSKIKANLFAKKIYQAFIQEYYLKNKCDVIQFIETKKKSCFEIIKEQDKKLLEQYQQNSTDESDQKIILYITDQKKFIEDYAKKTIEKIKNEIIKEQQQKLTTELNNYLFILKNNVNLIYMEVQLQEKEGLKTIDYFEKQDIQIDLKKKDNQSNQSNVEFEQEMFEIIKTCIFKKKTKPIKKNIKTEYKQYFQIDQFQELPFQINVQMASSSDEEIQQLKPYLQEFLQQISKQLNDCKNEKLDVTKFQIQNVFDNIQLNMIGCQESCRLCKRKCDQQFEINTEHKHQCQNGHQLRGMNFVSIEDKPSLFTCEEISDDMLLITQQTSKIRTWKEIKTLYKDWDFGTLILQNDENHQKYVKNKMMNVWNGGIGQLLCEILSKKHNKAITFITKHNLQKYEQQRLKLHYIFMLDDSGSMEGQKWENAKNGALTCMEEIEKNPNAKVSVIIFNSNARVAIDCEKVNIKSFYDKITFAGGLTNFESAFQSVFAQIKKHQKEKFVKNFILFYTDGGDSYPKQAMKQFIEIPLEEKRAIQLIACSQESNPSTLSTMVTNLKENGYIADLKANIQQGDVEKVWTEVILQGVHIQN